MALGVSKEAKGKHYATSKGVGEAAMIDTLNRFSMKQ